MAVSSAQCQASEAAQPATQALDNGEFTLKVPCWLDQFGLSILQISEVIVIGELKNVGFYSFGIIFYVLWFYNQDCKRKGKIIDSYLNAFH